VRSFPELKVQAYQSLIDFLNFELKLGVTFVDLAKQYRTEKDRAKSIENARKAVEAIRHFEGRIRDHAEWAEIRSETNELEKLLNSKNPLNERRNRIRPKSRSREMKAAQKSVK